MIQQRMMIQKLRLGMQCILAMGVMIVSTYSIEAQMVNQGELTIMPNTQVGVLDPIDNASSGIWMNDGELFCYNHFNNDGMVDFLNEGLTRFEGSTVQRITGSSESFFYDLLFNNGFIALAFQLAGNITVENEANFDTGVVDGQNFGGLLSFTAGADHINTSDNSHMDGTVIKNGDNSFDFPIGNAGQYRPATINAPQNVLDQITGRYILENSDPTYSHGSAVGVIERIDNTEYWVVERTNGNSNVVLTLGWDADTSPSFITAANPNSLHIIRWDANQGFWVDEGGIPDAANQTVTTIAEVSGYGVFTLATVSVEEVLPGGLVSYNAVSPNGNGENDFFRIDGIERFPNNTMEVFNRWGVPVYKTKGYNLTDNVFRGFSEGNLTLGGSEPLPTGTYFYVLTYEFSENGSTPRTVRKTGFLYIDAN
ncbi:gliding motility-associated C-terminal domain-containing protein [Spongiimicrobium sp. 2-473A-2-J]|uniref:gliding motility-associated C-terminal domain-containing protein n=1 Tax=Eudoraea algarum TaxID=3417568 RepID=UPI003D36930D